MTNTATEALPSRWDINASFWVQIIREHRDRYRNELTDPAMLHAIGTPDGLTVLDAGCGEGYFSRVLARNGATVVGIDSSARLIEAAKAQDLTDGIPVSFDVGSVDELPYPGDRFDLVICNHVLNDLYDPSRAISEFARVLRDGGRLIILMLHPCFYNKHVERGPGHQRPNRSFILRDPQHRADLRGRRPNLPHSQHCMVPAIGVLHRATTRVRLRDHQPDRATPITEASAG